jgi:hypothetical protein
LPQPNAPEPGDEDDETDWRSGDDTSSDGESGDDEHITEPSKVSSLFQQKLSNILTKAKKKKQGPASFVPIMQELIYDLIEKSSMNNKSALLAVFTTVFKPGLFTNAVFAQGPLILKHLPNLSTAVFERFNELFNPNASLLLTEDVCNTFTTSSNKTINELSSGFRIIVLSASEARRNLSEAALSRITTIFFPEYSLAESQVALGSMCHRIMLLGGEISSLQIDIFGKAYSNRYRTNLPFPILSKVLNLFGRFCKGISDESRTDMGVAIYRVLAARISVFRQTRELATLIKESRIAFPEALSRFLRRDVIFPFVENFEAGLPGLKSEFTGLQIPFSTITEPGMKVALVPQFLQMIDVIHMGISLHHPVIIQASTGFETHTAIEYVSKSLGFKIVKFTLSNATTIEDLFCKVVTEPRDVDLEFVLRESRLLMELNAKTAWSNTIVVLEELNSASPAVLDALVPLFDTTKRNFLLLNMIPGDKHRLELDYQIAWSMTRFTSCAEYSNEDGEQIVKSIFEGAKCESERKLFLRHFHNITASAKRVITSDLFTLNDIRKFVTFRERTYDLLEYPVIEHLILIYRFSDQNDITLAREVIHNELWAYWPCFVILNNNFSVSPTTDMRLGIEVPIRYEIVNRESFDAIDSLTISQRHCLVFLMRSVLSRQPCILQGPTASGKSHIVRLFAQLLGRKLVIIQLNNDVGISALIGQFLPKSELSADDTRDLLDVLQQFPGSIKQKLEAVMSLMQRAGLRRNSRKP